MKRTQQTNLAPACSAFFVLIFLLFVPLARAAEEMFDFETLRYRAKLLAAKAYEPRASHVPQALSKLTYDQLRRIRFDPEHSWWRRERLPFQLQFFHPGFIYNQAVQISEVNGKHVRSIAFDRALFDYDGLDVGHV